MQTFNQIRKLKSPSTLISIIVPVYNSSKYLQRCLDSILSQSFSDFELLLINDGSTDCSGTICETYSKQDSRILVINKSNGGVSSARNLGIDNARGEWIAFCDSDDTVLPDWLSNFVIGNLNNYDLVCQGMQLLNMTRDKQIKTEDITNSFEGDRIVIWKSLKSCNSIGHVFTKLFRKSIIQSNSLRFDESIRFMEDEEFFLRYLTFVNQGKGTGKCGYCYFIPESGKYSEDFFKKEYLFKTCYKNVCRYSSSGDGIRQYYLDSLIEAYLEELKCNKDNRKYCIRQLNVLLREHSADSDRPAFFKKAFRYNPSILLYIFYILRDWSRIVNISR